VGRRQGENTEINQHNAAMSEDEPSKLKRHQKSKPKLAYQFTF
jgi:hypothetical protein